MNKPDIIGWFSSAVLLITIMRQTYTQWKTGATAGVSRWLFVGQLTASTGYTVYSYLLHNWVFLTSNIALLLTALIGEVLYILNKRKEDRAPATNAN
jgi:MtN3 and saliva related transmembrane protein